MIWKHTQSRQKSLIVNSLTELSGGSEGANFLYINIRDGNSIYENINTVAIVCLFPDDNLRILVKHTLLAYSNRL